ncbi:MAG TPA: LysE family translocator [Phenylobacterium sp.]|nr:LysE family translocator [Phenylobacterium sp.]HMP61644.1 LysE family translocator [Phenylobacterium sp.]
MSSFTPQLLAGLALFAFVSSITPGPNNAMLMASGANYGFVRTLPHLAGVALGFMFLVACVGLGLGGLFEAWPQAHTVLKAVGAAYLLWLAWKIGQARGGPEAGAGEGRPFTFLQAAAFQWVNPKAWVMAVGALAAYLPPERPLAGVAVVAGVFGLVNLPCVAAWTGFGVGLRRLLQRPGALRVFNWTMAGLLALSTVPVLADLLGDLRGAG